VKIASSFSLPLRGTLPYLLFAFWFTRVPLAFAQDTHKELSPAELQIGRSYGTLPLSFERNQGQADPQVRFLSRGAGYSILFNDREVTLLLSKRDLTHETPLRIGERLPGEPRRGDTASDVLHMRIVGQSPAAVASGEARLPGTVNYFAGNDPAKWLSGVPTYERVRYASVYPGIGLAYYGNRQRLEFDFDLAPGADPRAIRLRFDGAKKLNLDRDGNLIVVAANGQVSFHKPASLTRGEAQQHPAMDGRINRRLT
jgi:hypothetical protein